MWVGYLSDAGPLLLASLRSCALPGSRHCSPAGVSAEAGVFDRGAGVFDGGVGLSSPVGLLLGDEVVVEGAQHRNVF